MAFDAMTWTLGIPDEEFYQRRPERGLLTKSEVRVIALSKLRLRPDSVVWDIGGGAGSVTIEAALLAPKGAVYVVERNDEDCENIRENIKKFGTGNVTLLQEQRAGGPGRLAQPRCRFRGRERRAHGSDRRRELPAAATGRTHCGGRGNYRELVGGPRARKGPGLRDRAHAGKCGPQQEVSRPYPVRCAEPRVHHYRLESLSSSAHCHCCQQDSTLRSERGSCME